MNEDTLKGQWTQIKGRVREQWGSSPMTTSTRSRVGPNSSSARFQERYGVQRDEAKRQVDDFLEAPSRRAPAPILSNEATNCGRSPKRTALCVLGRFPASRSIS